MAGDHARERTDGCHRSRRAAEERYQVHARHLRAIGLRYSIDQLARCRRRSRACRRCRRRCRSRRDRRAHGGRRCRSWSYGRRRRCYRRRRCWRHYDGPEFIRANIRRRSRPGIAWVALADVSIEVVGNAGDVGPAAFKHARNRRIDMQEDTRSPQVVLRNGGSSYAKRNRAWPPGPDKRPAFDRSWFHRRRSNGSRPARRHRSHCCSTMLHSCPGQCRSGDEPRSRPVPLGTERLSMMLLRRFSVAVVAVALAVWKIPGVLKSVAAR